MNITIPAGYYQLPDGSDFLEGDKYFSNGCWNETINHVNGKQEGWKVNSVKGGFVYIRKISNKPMIEKIKINGQSYDLDIARATELGVLKSTHTYSSLKEGDIFTIGTPDDDGFVYWIVLSVNGNILRLLRIDICSEPRIEVENISETGKTVVNLLTLDKRRGFSFKK